MNFDAAAQAVSAATRSQPYDSGYGTISHGDSPDKVLHARLGNRLTQDQDRDYGSVMHSVGEWSDDAPSIPDDGSLPDRANNFASNIANELLVELKELYTQQHWDTIRAVLPNRLGDFAIRIGSQGDTQLHRDVMWVAHNATLAIVKAVEEGIANIDIADDEDEDGPARVTDDPLGLHEKIRYLTTRPDLSYPKDDEGVTLPPIEIEPYRQVLNMSEAFSWLLSMLRQDTKLTTGRPLAMQEIRDAIVGPFYNPTRRIRRTEKPQIIEMTFVVDWDPIAFLTEQMAEEPFEPALGRVITPDEE